MAGFEEHVKDGPRRANITRRRGERVVEYTRVEHTRVEVEREQPHRTTARERHEEHYEEIRIPSGPRPLAEVYEEIILEPGKKRSSESRERSHVKLIPNPTVKKAGTSAKPKPLKIPAILGSGTDLSVVRNRSGELFVVRRKIHAGKKPPVLVTYSDSTSSTDD